MFDIKSIFPPAKKPPVKVIIGRAMAITIDGAPRHVDVGDELEIPHDLCAQLDPSDYQRTSAFSPQTAVEIADPTPPREESAPLPDRWSELPSCFADWHRMSGELVTARKHISAIRETRRRIFGTDADFSEVEGTFLAGGMSGGDNRQNVHSSLSPLSMSDPTTKKLARYLAAGLAEAEDWLARLREKTGIPLQKAWYECGLHAMTLADQSQTLVDEIKATGYAIFSNRLAPLGLADSHQRRLFAGSADYLRYGILNDAHSGGRCFGGQGDDGEMRIYSDESPPTSATRSLSDTARIPELESLLRQAQAELLAAQKVASRAA